MKLKISYEKLHILVTLAIIFYIIHILLGVHYHKQAKILLMISTLLLICGKIISNGKIHILELIAQVVGVIFAIYYIYMVDELSIKQI
jgi:hypothetical protein